jgi:glycosyltransferase involved in cell wall biosynthesis
MRIAFASEHPNKKSAFSGVPYYMSRAIAAESEFFEYIECPKCNIQLIKNGTGWKQIESIGKFLSERLATMDIDAVICQGSSMIPFLKTDKCVVLWHDSMWFSLMRLDFNQFRSRYPLLYEWDRLVLDRCNLIVFAAEWVREQIIAHYMIDPKKIHVLPFGANIEPISQQEVVNAIASRGNTVCRLTFIGIDWLRKGLPNAYQVANRLNRNGIRAELSVIGCDVPSTGLTRPNKSYSSVESLERFQIQYHHDANVKKIGFLSKDEPSDYNCFSDILRNTHFLLHPAIFECFGIALVEANAFGVPVLSTDHYGPQTTIRGGANGHLFSQHEYECRASATIMCYMSDIDSYRLLALRSHTEYRERLNWHTSNRILQELVKAITN